MSHAGNLISKQSSGGADSTVVAQACCQSVQSHIDPVRMHGSSHEAHCLRFAPKNALTSSRNVVYHATLDETKDGHSSSLILNPSFSEHRPCGNLRPQLSGALVEPRPLTSYAPRQLAEDQDYQHFTEDQQLTEHEDVRVKTLVLPPIDHSVDLRLSGKHRDTAPESDGR